MCLFLYVPHSTAYEWSAIYSEGKCSQILKFLLDINHFSFPNLISLALELSLEGDILKIVTLLPESILGKPALSSLALSDSMP